MRYLFLLLLLNVLPFSGNTQDVKPKTAFTVKIYPLELISPFQQSFTVYSDIPLARRWSVDAGVGAVLDSWEWAAYKNETYQGIRLRTGIKYYMYQTENMNISIGLALKYSQIENERYVTVSRQGGQYNEWLLGRRRVKTSGASIYFASQQFLGPRKRFFVEPFVGLGVRHHEVTREDLPPDAEIAFPFFRIFNLELDQGTHNTPDMLLGCYLGWRF